MQELFGISPRVRYCGVSKRSRKREAYTISSEKYNVFIFVTKGDAQHEVNGVKRPLVQGALEIIPPFFHQVITTFSEDDTEIYYIYFDINETVSDTSGEGLFETGVPSSELYFADKPCYKRLSGEAFETARSIVEEMLECYQKNDQFSALDCKSLMLRLILIFLKADVVGEEPFFSSADRHVARAMRYIESGCSHNGLCSKSVAAHIGLSTDYLSGLFESRLHITLPGYIRMTRIKRAKELLFCGERIGSVAAKCGFSSVQSFCRTFRAQEGMTPGEFMKQYGGK